MKKLIIAAAFILFAGIAFGQTLKTGAVIATTSWEVTLQPDATMNQFLEVAKKYCSAFEKAYPGVKVFTLMGERGSKKHTVSTLLFFESQELREKYWPAEGEIGPFDQAAQEILAPVLLEGNKILIKYEVESTDWVIL